MAKRKVFRKVKTAGLRIASYNILYGGKKRLKSISSVITEINPDICGILEVVGSKNDFKKLERIAHNLGYKLFYLAVANSKFNIALFSKINLTINTIKTGFRHVVLSVNIKNGPFEKINIFFVHLSPVSEDARISELKNLFKYTSKLKDVIIIGDFNSLSPVDPYNKKTLIKIFQENKITKYGIKILRFDAISKIISSGFVDAVIYLQKDFSSTTPTLSNKDINHAANIRIDYAFLSKNLLKRLYNMETFKNDDTEKASDHYPIFIELH